MDQDKSKEINLPENLKSKLLRFKELQEEADLRRKKVQNSDKEITEYEQGKTEQ